MKDIYDILREFRNRTGQTLALATLVRVEGSSYRRIGARMLICEDGLTIGSLSGGCLEEEVASRAREVLQSGQPVTMNFDTRKLFGCHGQIDIFVERVRESFLIDLAEQLEARRSCFAITTSEGSSVLVGEVNSSSSTPPLIQQIHPPIRLMIFGEGPDSIPLVRFCDVLGWQASTVVDPNTLSLEPDEWTAAIVKSHNYGRDFAALHKLLPINLRYVALIGPRKRRDQLLHDLLDIGIPINADFFAPAGLDLGADTPEEIALAIVSEIQNVFAEGSGEPLRDRKAPIHGWSLRPEQLVRPPDLIDEWQMLAR